MSIDEELSYDEHGIGATFSDRQAAEVAEKWIPRLQELDPTDQINLDWKLYKIRELEDAEAYIEVMHGGLWFFMEKYDGPIPQDFIEDIKGFLAPTRDKDWATQGSIRYKLDKLGIHT